MSLSKYRLNYRLRMIAVAFIASLTLGTLTAFSQGSARLAEDAPDEYVVQQGDTLWDIAATFLQRPLVLARNLVCQSPGRESTPYLSG